MPAPTPSQILYAHKHPGLFPNGVKERRAEAKVNTDFFDRLGEKKEERYFFPRRK
jgi:hypothetical protein